MSRSKESTGGDNPRSNRGPALREAVVLLGGPPAITARAGRMLLLGIRLAPCGLPGFFRTAKAILVPGMNFCGLGRRDIWPEVEVSADPRQLLAVQHVDNALDTKGATTRDLPGRPSTHRADDGGGAGHRVPPQQRDGPGRILGRDKGDEASFISYVERIEAEKLAGRGDLGAHRDRLFFERDSDPRCLCDLDKSACQSAAGQTAQAVNGNACLDQIEHRPGHQRTVALDLGFECESLARRHHGDPVAADVAAEDDDVARPHAARLDRGRRYDPAHSTNMPSALPRSTTLVSPVTSRTPAVAAASRIDSAIRRKVAIGSPFSSMKPTLR
jgi:hypothetical protein